MPWRVCFVAAVAVLVSCFIKPDPPGVGTDGPSRSDAPITPGDGPTVDTTVQFGCTNHSLDIHFSGMVLSNCGNSWATTIGGPIGTSGGPLMMQTQISTLSSCTSRTLGPGGAISVIGIPSSPGDALFLHAVSQASQLTTLRIAITASARTLELNGTDGVHTMPYDPTSMKWLRLRADGPTDLVAEYSDGGMNWVKLGTESTSGEPATSLTMSFGVSSTAQGSGAFEDYVQCQ